MSGNRLVVNSQPAEGAAVVQAGLGRRLGAAWVDVFFLYAVSSFMIGVAAAAGVRLALEPAIIGLGIAYGVVCLGCFGGRTIGKALLGLAVTGRKGGNAGWARICVREGVGKWILLILAPCIVGRIVFRAYWVPSAYDLAAILPLLVLTLLYYFCFRGTWYDQIAGTIVRRSPVGPAVTKRAFALLLGAAVLGGGVKGIEWASLGMLPSRTMLYYGMGSTRPYREFLDRATVAPTDYIFDLFERYDVVVLCERSHSEATQWDFIFDVVKDPRFSERVGHVFTELGQLGMQSRLDEFMATPGLSEAEIDARTLEIMRNWSVWPRWNRVNFPTYLKRQYALNQTLPAEKRIRLHFTDGWVDWPNVTKETMPEHWRGLQDRDKQMADVVIEEINRLDKAGGKPAKSLVVMNFRHAFDLTGGDPQRARYNTFEFLRDALHDRVANVRINEDLFWPVAGGLWNRAFAEHQNRPAGFDLAGSPFGGEPFDLFPWWPALRGQLKYQDVFTGLVFVNPAGAQYFLDGIPGYYQGWEDEIRRRAVLFGDDWVKTIEREIAMEEQGRVLVKTPPVMFAIESWITLCIGSIMAVGLGLGLVAVTFRTRVQAPVPIPSRSIAAAAVRHISPWMWLVFAGAVVVAIFVHEVGHCIVAWGYGVPAIPTAAKEYILGPLPDGGQNAMALGGIVGSVVALLAAAYWFYRRPGAMRSAVLAGAMTLPGFYVLRFMLAGRGHDGTEFQETQAALGMGYSGHTMDWLFVGLFVLAGLFWFWRARPALTFRLVVRLIAGVVVGLAVLVFLQVGNNALFDPLLQR